MDLISIGAGLICLIGACAGLAFLAEEGMSTTWTGLEDVNRWVKVKLDSIGQLAELDSDWDLETGAMGDWLIPEVCGVVLMGYGCVATRSVFRFGDPREASLAAGEPQAVSLPRPHGGPVRRSVHRQVAGGVSAAATPGDASRGRLSEFGKFFEGPSNDQRDQYGSSPGHGSGVNAHAVASPLPAALPLRPQLSEGAVSGDAKAARLADLRHGAGSFSGGVRGVRQDADGVVEGDGAHNVLDHSRSRAPYYGRNAQGGSAGARGMPEPSRAAATPGTSTRAPADQVRWDEEQRIPMYVPDQKQGYLSQATHRRTSSRSLGVEIDAWDAVGGDHGRGIGVASIADNAAPQSPFVLSRCSPDRRHPASAFGASFTGLSRSGAEADVDAPSSSSMSLGDDESLPPQSDGVLGMREEMRELLVRSDRGQALDSRGPTVQRVSQSGRSVPETAEDDTVARLNVARGKNASISASARSPLIGSSCVEDDWLGQAAAEVARGESGLYGGKGSPGLADGKAMTPLLNMDASGTPGLPDVAARSVFWNEDVDEESSRGAEGVDDAGGGEGNFSPHSPSWPMPPYDRTFTGVRRRVSPRASQQYLEGGGGWAPASPVRAEGGWEGGEGRPRSVSLFASQDVSSGGGNEFLGSSANDPLPSARARYSTVDQAERTSASVWLRENPKVEAGCAAGGLGSAAREGGPMASGREIAVSTSYSLPSPAGVLSSPLPDPSRNLAGISPGGPRIVGGARSGDSSPRPGLSSSSADGGARPPAAEEEGEKDTGSEGVERCVQAPTGAMCHVLGADVTAAAAAAAAAAVAGGGGDRDTPAGLLHSSPIFDRDKCLVGNAMVAWNAVERAIPGEVPQGGYAAEVGPRGTGSETASPELKGVEVGAGVPETAGVVGVTRGYGEEDARVEGPFPRRADMSDLETGAGSPPFAAELGMRPAGGDRYAREERDLNPALRLSERQDLHVPFEELELTQVIGGGCSGQVYRGAWKGTPVAIKVLVPMPEGDSEEKKWASFVAEVQMLAALRHPNVCLFMGACVTPPNRAIVTELVSRGSLWQALRNPVLPLDLASQSDAAGGSGSRHPRHLGHFRTPEDCWPWSIILKVAEGMACGMNYLHRHEPVPILHRDLKSANVLLDDAFGVKICDFGMARLKALTSSMTGNCGTVQWMAPEVLTSQKYTETADVYSFAVVCWELLTRACPYEGMSQIQVAVAVINDGLRPDIPAWCPEEFRALIEACWDGDPGKRGEFEAILRFLRQSS